jgi:PGF-pre-PGF domain-containing protein
MMSVKVLVITVLILTVFSIHPVTAEFKLSHVFDEMDINKIGAVNISEPSIGVTEIKVNVSENVKNAGIIIERVYESQGETPPGIVYQYFDISNADIPEASLSEVKIKFRVLKSWIQDNDVEKASVSLYKMDGQWAKLDTSLLSEDVGFVYYEATTSRLSLFSVTGVGTGDVCGDGVCGEGEDCIKDCGIDETEKCVMDEVRCLGSDMHKCTPDGTWSITYSCKYGCDVIEKSCKPPESGGEISPFFMIFIIGVIIIAISAVGIVKSRKHL